MSSSITIIGNVGTDPTPTILPGGARKVTFRVAASERYFDRKRNAWVDADPSWFTVEAFRALGEHVQASVHRGDNVIVSGRLRVRTWENEKGRGTAVDVEADAVGHNLTWGTSTYVKALRPETTPPVDEPTTSAGADQEQRPDWATPLVDGSGGAGLVGVGTEDTPF